jgi:outer membrane immunogenic protein
MAALGNWAGDVMNKLIAAGATIAALIASPALAADMPVKVPYKAPLPYSWTGCYVGFDFGAGYARVSDTWLPSTAFTPASFADITAVSNGTMRPGALLVGGVVGCDYQAGLTVVGIVSDFDYSYMNPATVGVTTAVFGDAITQSFKSNWLGTTRGRLGFSNGPYNSFGNWIVYLTGGVAYANLQYTDIIFFPPSGTTNTAINTQTKVGWVAGFGTEFQTIGPWTMKFEFLYVDLGKTTTTSFNNSPAFAAATIQNSHYFTEYVAKFGFNYRFGPTAVVARY